MSPPARMLGIALALFTLNSTGHTATSTNTPAVAGPKSRVALVRDPGAVTGFNFDAAKVRAMIAAGMKTLTGQPDDVTAWRQFVGSNDVIGIKISTLGAPLQVTRHEVVDAIVDGLQRAGVAGTNIIVWDRDALKMRAGGYKVNPDGPGRRIDRKSTRLNSSHVSESRMPSSA